jgi:hypothetical protein
LPGIALLISDFLAIHAYSSFSYGRSMNAAYLSADLLRTAAAVVLRLALHRTALRGTAGRGSRAAPRALPALLLGGITLPWIAWNAALADQAYNASGHDIGWVVSGIYPEIETAVLGLIIGVLATIYAIRTQDRLLGAVLVLGWTTQAFAIFQAHLTFGVKLDFALSFLVYYTGTDVDLNWLATILMLATAVLAVVYATRRQLSRHPALGQGRGSLVRGPVRLDDLQLVPAGVALGFRRVPGFEQVQQVGMLDDRVR